MRVAPLSRVANALRRLVVAARLGALLAAPLAAQVPDPADVARWQAALDRGDATATRRAGVLLERRATALLHRAAPPALEPPLADEWRALTAGAAGGALDRDLLLLHLDVLFEACRDDALPDGVRDAHELVARHASAEALAAPLAGVLELLVEETLARATAAAFVEPDLPPPLPFEEVVDEALAAWDATQAWGASSPAHVGWRIERHAAERQLPIAQRVELQALAHAARGGAPARPDELQQLLRCIELALRAAPPGGRVLQRRLDLLSAAAAAAERGGLALLARAARAAEVDGAVQRGDLAQASRHLETLLPRLHDRSLPHDFTHLVGAVALRRLGRWDECLALLEAASGADGEPAFVARAAGEYGVALADLGLLDLAAPWIEREWSLARTLGADSRSPALFHLADLRERQRDLAGALELLSEALAAPRTERDAARDLGRARSRLLIRLGHAQLLAEQSGAAPGGERRASRRALQEALADPLLALPDRVDALQLLGLAALLDGDAEAARAALEQAGRHVAAAGSPPQSLLARALRETVLAMAALHDAPVPIRAGDAARLQERRAAAATVLAELVEEWRRIAPREGGIGFLSLASRRALLGALIELELRLEPDGAGALARLDEVGALGSLVRAAGSAASTTSPSPSQRFEPGSGALVWLPSWIASRVLLIDAQGVALFPLGSELALAQATQSLDLALQLSVSGALPLDAADRERAVEAWRAALLPAAAEERCAAWRERTVVLGEPLANGPLALLFRDGRPVATLPSLRAATVLAARPRAEPAIDVAWVAAPQVEETDEGALAPLAERVAALGLRERFAGGRLVGHEGSAATVAALRTTLAQGVTLLHCFTHGRFDPARRRPAGLLLCDGAGGADALWCDQVAALGGRVDAVLLAVCNAARGPRRIGDESIGDLGGAFLAAGARSVLLTHAPVPIAATTRLMAAVHGELARGASLAGALAAARGALDEEAAQVGALFRVVGLGHEPLFAPGRFTTVATAPSGVAPSGTAPPSEATSAATARAPDEASEHRPWRRWGAPITVVVVVAVWLAWLRAGGRRRRRATGS